MAYRFATTAYPFATTAHKSATATRQSTTTTLELMSPTMGDDLLDSLGELSVPGWSPAIEQSEQVGTLGGDESEMKAAMGSAGTVPSADDLVRSLTSMSDVKVVSFLASDVNAQNLGWMQRVARAALLEPIHVTSTLTIPTPLGAANVSLTTTRTPSSTVTTYSLCAHKELL